MHVHATGACAVWVLVCWRSCSMPPNNRFTPAKLAAIEPSSQPATTTAHRKHLMKAAALLILIVAMVFSSVQGLLSKMLPGAVKAPAAALTMVKAGSVAPDFTLTTSEGKPFKLSSFKGKKNVVLFFYPKSDTPGCTKEACAFTAELPVFAKAGTEIVGISSDADQAAFKAKYNLGVTLLSDPGGAVRKLYNVPKAMFGALDGRVTYVIGKDGIVKKVHDNLIDAESHVSISKAALGI